MLFSLQTAEGETVDGIAVTIDASGPLRGGGVVHAIAVTQPVQSWAVLRTQNDFIELGRALAQVLAGAPPCPQPLDPAGDISAIVEIRNEMQAWLHTILSHPGACESPAVRNFLVYEANMIPPQYEGVAWVRFPSGASPEPVTPPTGQGIVDEMEMEEMFDGDYDGTHEQEEIEDDDEIIPASERYKQKIEDPTDEDFMDLAAELEMVEDVGFLAQSLGASHLGRSLQLQAQMAQPVASHRTPNAVSGVRLGGAASPGGTPLEGGIGSAIQNAGRIRPGQMPAQQQALTTPTRLDSFTLLKVIGKGSFGTLFFTCAM
jgi:hypothetical protein